MSDGSEGFREKLRRKLRFSIRSKQGTSIKSTSVGNPAPKPTGAPDAAVTPLLAPTRTSTAASPTSTKSTLIWARALHQIEQTELWSKYNLIVERNQLHPNSSAQGDTIRLVSAHQVQEISQLTTDLRDDRTETRNGPLRAFIEKTLSVVIAIKDAGSAVAALDPYASLAWTVVQFLVSAATTTYTVRTECYETLPRILEWVRRYQAFEEIYTSNGSDGPIMTELEETLERLYVSLPKYELICAVSVHSKMARTVSLFQRKDASPT